MLGTPPTTLDTAVPSLLIHGLVREFGETPVLQGLSLDHRSGGVLAVTGSNGSGKTTLLRILAQLTRPDGGSVEICGRDLETHGRSVRGLVGWVPDTPIAYRELSVQANLTLAARLAGLARSDGTKAVATVLQQWDLLRHAKLPVRSLSRGWRQRYSLARGLVHTPRVLLLDEPTDGLDVDGRDLLDQVLGSYTPTSLVVAASHDRTWLAQHASTWLHLEDPVRSLVRSEPVPV